VIDKENLASLVQIDAGTNTEECDLQIKLDESKCMNVSLRQQASVIQNENNKKAAQMQQEIHKLMMRYKEVEDSNEDLKQTVINAQQHRSLSALTNDSFDIETSDIPIQLHVKKLSVFLKIKNMLKSKLSKKAKMDDKHKVSDLPALSKKWSIFRSKSIAVSSYRIDNDKSTGTTK